MSFAADQEILQDFIVEAGEILELLSTQLVELESNPDDMDLLNAIFRGFHTVKGGAGFLQLNPLVDCCHVAENVFDVLRKGELSVTAELMDVVLEALDSVTDMFEEVRAGQPLTPASDELLTALAQLIEPDVQQPAQQPQQPAAVDQMDAEFEQMLAALPEPAQQTTSQDSPESSDTITDDEFEALLDELHGPVSGSKSDAQAAPSDEITDEEFEALLDELHGPINKQAAETEQATDPAAASASDEITDAEFEALLDQLHGEGQFNVDNTLGQASNAAESSAVAESDPAAATTDAAQVSDDEFAALLDKLHGAGKFKVSLKQSTDNSAAADRSAAETETNEPTVNKPKDAPAAPAPKPAAAPRPAAGNAPIVETTVRVDTARLDDIMNMVGELVLVRNRLVRLGLDSDDEVMSQVVGHLDVVTGDLQAAVMKTRMQPIRKVFGRFPRLVRDMARTLNKQIRLELLGEDTDLDKNLVEALADPLVHLVRNAVDHGIEAPAEREAAGKQPEGCVVLSAAQEGDHIQLTISDDGKGMDADVLRSKAVENGLLDQEAAERLTDSECYNLIFAAGFSTKTEVSDVSGRGVGMDVVKTKITQLNGTVFVHSTPGEGSQVVIKVPLTLAIMPTLMVMQGGQAFAFPLVNVDEIFHLDLSRTNTVDGQEVVIVRDKTLPLFYLKDLLLGAGDTAPTEGHVVILTVGNQRIGCVVDQLIGQEEVVIKPLGRMLQGTPGMSGATITGDGRIALILDVPGLLRNNGQRY